MHARVHREGSTWGGLVEARLGDLETSRQGVLHPGRGVVEGRGRAGRLIRPHTRLGSVIDVVGDQDVGLAVVVEVGDRGREGWRDGGVNGEGLDGAQAEGGARGAIAPGQAQAGAGEEGGVHKLGLQAGKEVQEEAGGYTMQYWHRCCWMLLLLLYHSIAIEVSGYKENIRRVGTRCHHMLVPGSTCESEQRPQDTATHGWHLPPLTMVCCSMGCHQMVAPATRIGHSVQHQQQRGISEPVHWTVGLCIMGCCDVPRIQ